VTRFSLGFLVASLLWLALAAGLYLGGVVALAPKGDADEPAPVAQASDPAASSPDAKRRRRPRRSIARPPRTGESEERRGRATASDLPQGEATIGDDLDWNGAREVDMAQGEGQLTGAQIEAGFDGAMARIRRCLVLVPAEGDVTGTLTFGMRVGGDGQPRAVSLTGPAVVTRGESGDCLRKAAQAIRFGRFDGPEMLFRYPITLH